MRNMISSVLKLLKEDRSDSASFLYDFFLNPKYKVMLNYRLGVYIQNSKFFLHGFFLNILRYRMVVRRGCDISYSAIIGKKLHLPHPIGIVIGDDVIIKDNVTIFQNVTLGSHGKVNEELKYPEIGNGVKIYAGAKIIGGISVGEEAVIGANSVVTKDVPPRSVIVGVPGRIIASR
ncbi:serine acetyltransferase [Echinicola jeungdonensis]|uniref:Serine acetyltransferase n=1 Tax=Echinicola jeungdonensis TaxID=709343 RepID=A0ABV5J3Q6_9BACT|nr:serine acetyltransferase [Echinicola jeungdonensis]MDN3668122.1 serine acetyltransferase [Echinicola jeungdonensis]